MKAIKNYYYQNVSPKCYTTSTFLVPEKYLDHYNERCQFFGSRRAYLSFMVEFYLPRAECFKKALEARRNPKWKTDYQSRGLYLCRRNFVPLPDDWEEFRNFAWAFGVSMCFLFVFLMEQEMAGIFTNKHEQTHVYSYQTAVKQDYMRSKHSRLLDKKDFSLLRKLKKE